MKQDAFDRFIVLEEVKRTQLEDTPIEPETHVSLRKETSYHELSIETLVAHCWREIKYYRSGEPYNDAYGLELLRRAIVQEDEQAWAGVQHCFSGMVHGWLLRHPKRDMACRFDSNENYVAQTFERFWQATTSNRHIEFMTLAAALHYLHASLNGVILDTLRAYVRPREVMLPEFGELQVEDTSDKSEVWDALQTILSDEQEKRLAYLLFHCGLKPREIMRFCPQEWHDVHEIYRLKRNIMDRLLHNADQLRWKLR